MQLGRQDERVPFLERITVQTEPRRKHLNYHGLPTLRLSLFYLQRAELFSFFSSLHLQRGREATAPSRSEKDRREEEAATRCKQWLPPQRLAWMLLRRLFYQKWPAFSH